MPAATISSMEIAVALLSGLLGGGVTGAIVGGLVTLQQQRRAFDQERQTRFIDLKRERYAALLRGTDDFVRILVRQREMARALERGDAKPFEVPSLSPTTELEQLADEIDLLASESVGGPATRLVISVIALASYAYNPNRQGPRMEALLPINEAMARYTQDRSLFLAAAKADLGTT
jgi:hypothetical protein